MRRFFIRFFAAAAIGIAWMTACLAASELIFPRLSFDNTFTGIAIANPGKTSARIALTAYSLDGSILQGAGQNPRSIDLAAGQQFVDVVANIFNAPRGFKGWILAQSDADNLTGFFLMGGAEILDGSDLPLKALDCYYNLLLDPSKYQSEISLVNPNSSQADITLNLVSASGSQIQSRNLSLAAKGALQATLETLFSSAEISQAASLHVKSKVPVAGFEFVFARDGSKVVGLTAQPTARKLSTLNFPQLAVLGDWATQVGVFNLGSQLALVTLTAYKPDGTLYGAPDIIGTNPFRVAIAANGAFTADVETLFGFQGGATLQGWLKVETSQPALHGFVAYGTKSKPTLAAVTAQAEGITNALFSHQANGSGFYTGLAILNAGTVAANLEITSLTKDGRVLGSVKKVLGALERIVNVVPGFVPEAAGAVNGLVVISSDLPLFVTELFGTENLSSLANVPAQAAPASYSPNPALISFQLSPSTVVPVQLKSRQSFKAKLNGNLAGDVVWSVNGKVGGDSVNGFIDSQGVYTAPASHPPQGRVTVRAETRDGRQVAGSSIDLVRKEAFQADVNFLRSQTYLSGLKKLYVAELAGVAGKVAPGPYHQQVGGSVNTIISELSPIGQKKAVRTFSKTNVLSVIPYTDSRSNDYLLISSYDSGQPLSASTGKVSRYDPARNQNDEIATGLKLPVAMTVDEASGDLLVADQETNAIVSVAKSKLDPNVRAKTGSSISLNPRYLFAAQKPGGLIVDGCSGAVYTSETNSGRILRFDRKTKQTATVITGLQKPTRLFGLFRSGLDCSADADVDAFFFFVAEEPTSGNNGKLTLIIPSLGEPLRLVEDLQFIPDISLIDPNNPYVEGGEEAITFSEERADAPDQIFFSPVGEEYEETKPDKIDQAFDKFTVFGAVFQDSDGLSGITIVLKDNATGKTVATGTTDLFGEYQFENVPIGNYTVTPTASTHTFTPASRMVPVVDDDVELADFDANPNGGFTINGFVTDSRGRPIFDAGIVIADANGNAYLSFTAKDGSFRRRGLPNGVYAVVPFFSDLNFDKEFAIIQINSANQSVTFAATSQVWNVTGKITAVDGVPPAYTFLLLYDTESEETHYEFADAAGNYQFLSIPESADMSRYELYAYLRGFQITIPQNPSADHYVFGLTADLQPSQIPFESRFVGYDISGEVFDSNLKPIAGVTIRYGNASTTSAADGSFTLSKLKNNVQVSASKSGFSFLPEVIGIDLQKLIPDEVFFVGTSAPIPPPTIQSMGASVSPGAPVTISGSGLSSDVSQLQVRFGSALASIISATPTQIRVWVPMTLAAGPVPVTVAVSGRSSAPFSYTVLRQIPLITSVNPQAISNGQKVTFNIRGENFSGSNPQASIDPDAGLSLVGAESQVVSSNEMRLTYLAGQGLAPGFRDLNVYFDSLQSNFFSLAVNPGGSTSLKVTGISPSVVKPGARVTFTITGSGFSAGGNVQIVPDVGSGLSFVSATVNSDSSLTAVYDIAPDAVLGKKHFQIAVGSNISDFVEFVVAP
ncbi:MAG TPA: IPT/TIG domain-containing protein [Acidobacteriota bacterium]|jgi:hypothetical protein|nr:IPT/TIG domain-containing protein [Acidobacteriota bacterium]